MLKTLKKYRAPSIFHPVSGFSADSYGLDVLYQSDQLEGDWGPCVLRV